MSVSAISSFSGKNRFLSNFWLCRVTFEGVEYDSTEHAYQAAKTVSEELREWVRTAPSPGQAKKRAYRLTLRPDWDDVKEHVMLALLREKFKDPELRAKLLATGDAELVEGNTWGDKYWGVCDGEGQNRLGVLLMLVRDEVKNE